MTWVWVENRISLPVGFSSPAPDFPAILAFAGFSEEFWHFAASSTLTDNFLAVTKCDLVLKPSWQMLTALLNNFRQRHLLSKVIFQGTLLVNLFFLQNKKDRCKKWIAFTSLQQKRNHWRVSWIEGEGGEGSRSKHKFSWKKTFLTSLSFLAMWCGKNTVGQKMKSK